MDTSYAVSSEIGNKSESKFPRVVPSTSVSSLGHEVLPKTHTTFYEMEIR